MVLPQAKNLWKEYQLAHLPASSTLSYEETRKNQEPPDDYDLIKAKLKGTVIQARQDYDEYDHFCNKEPYDIQEETPIKWWCRESQRKRWPLLSQFALEVLSIPAMSDEPERVFSSGRRTISWERMALGVSSVERTECLKSWYRGKFSLSIF